MSLHLPTNGVRWEKLSGLCSAASGGRGGGGQEEASGRAETGCFHLKLRFDLLSQTRRTGRSGPGRVRL